MRGAYIATALRIGWEIMKKQSLFLFFALTLRVSPLMRLFRHQQSSFIDVTIALINNIVTIIIIIVIANSREQLV